MYQPYSNQNSHASSFSFSGIPIRRKNPSSSSDNSRGGGSSVFSPRAGEIVSSNFCDYEMPYGGSAPVQNRNLFTSSFSPNNSYSPKNNNLLLSPPGQPLSPASISPNNRNEGDIHGISNRMKVIRNNNQNSFHQTTSKRGQQLSCSYTPTTTTSQIDFENLLFENNNTKNDSGNTLIACMSPHAEKSCFVLDDDRNLRQIDNDNENDIINSNKFEKIICTIRPDQQLFPAQYGMSYSSNNNSNRNADTISNSQNYNRNKSAPAHIASSLPVSFRTSRKRETSENSSCLQTPSFQASSPMVNRLDNIHITEEANDNNVVPIPQKLQIQHQPNNINSNKTNNFQYQPNHQSHTNFFFTYPSAPQPIIINQPQRRLSPDDQLFKNLNNGMHLTESSKRKRRDRSQSESAVRILEDNSNTSLFSNQNFIENIIEEKIKQDEDNVKREVDDKSILLPSNTPCNLDDITPSIGGSEPTEEIKLMPIELGGPEPLNTKLNKIKLEPPILQSTTTTVTEKPSSSSRFNPKTENKIKPNGPSTLPAQKIRNKNVVRHYKCTWEGCNSSYTKSSHLKAHVRRHTEDA